MTILSISQISVQPRMNLWRAASSFDNAAQWVRGVESVQHLRGNAHGVGGEWRIRLRTGNGAVHVVELEITEWLEGERFGLRPVRRTGVLQDIELLELIFDLSEPSPGATTITMQCEYEPCSKFGRLKNLAFLRRQYVAYLHNVLSALIQMSEGESLPSN